MNNITDLEQFKQLRKELNGSSPDAKIILKLIRFMDHVADRIIYVETRIEALEKQIEALDGDVDYLMKKEQE